jgi:hypothetical protein
MKARTYAVRLVGETPLLMHKDNIAHAEQVKLWSKDPANKKTSVAGDDRTPPWTWTGYVYENGGLIVIDADNIMACLRDGGKKCPSPTGKGSMKAITQSGIMCNELGWPLLVNGEMIETDWIAKLKEEEEFSKHEEAAREHGFCLFVKRARVGTSKHVRVRARFDKWEASGTLTVLDSQITTAALKNVLMYGGCYCGLGDWRPGSPQSPGQFGRFSAEVKEV